VERVAFLLEPSGRRLACLLNPEDVTFRREAGLRARPSAGGALAGRGLSDDPLHFTGGGRTEIELRLLFDVTLAGTTPHSPDVRDLTRPLWELAENSTEGGSYGRPPSVRFLWGKHWNLPVVVAAVAERFDRFDERGVPARSWLCLALRRVPEPIFAPPSAADRPLDFELPDVLEASPDVTSDEVPVHEVLGSGGALESSAAEAPAPATERLDEIAWQHFGDPRAWRELAEWNDLDDPLHLAPGQRLLLRAPPAVEVQP
jgi:hypothetical protein